MLRGALRGWKAAQKGLAQEFQFRHGRAFSDGATTSGAANSAGAQAKAKQTATAAATASESAGATTSRLFENVKPPEAMAGGAGAAAGEGEAPGAIGRVAGAVGNGLFLGGLAATAFFGYYTYRYTPDQLDTMVSETEKAENAFPGSGVWADVMKWYIEQRRYVEGEVKKYSDPPSEALLPDLPPQAGHVRTLVLDLDNLLVHSDWSRKRGWRTFKRPGAEDFLRLMSQYYEVVVYTSQLPTYADPILDRLDPNRYIAYRLYRDSTLYKDGKHVRDLGKLNRDLSKVMLVTSDPDAFYINPENAIKLDPWKLEADDTKLLDLMPFLEAVVRTQVPDVRKVVASYEGQDIPTAFKERMARMQERKRAPQSFLGGFGR